MAYQKTHGRRQQMTLGKAAQLPLSWGRTYVAFGLAALTAAACTAMTPTTTAPTSPSAGDAPAVGRSVCAGSVPHVLRQVNGTAADALEHLQGTYENVPGFMAVVHDGVTPIVVVDAWRLPEWQARLAPNHIALAPSCVDTRLLAAVHAALPRIAAGGHLAVSAGYDALDDAIKVQGVEPDLLLPALLEVWSDSDAVAQAAIAAGTLRTDPRPLPGLR